MQSRDTPAKQNGHDRTKSFERPQLISLCSNPKKEQFSKGCVHRVGDCLLIKLNVILFMLHF